MPTLTDEQLWRIVTLAVSGLALAASVAALAWQVWSWALSGGRIKVYLLVGEQDESMLSQAPPRAWRKNPPKEPPLTPRPWAREVATIRIHNRGRVAGTVEPPSLRVGNRSMTNAKPLDDQGEGLVKIEPGDFKRWTLDVWPMIRGFQNEHPGKVLRIRGGTVQGANRWKLSSRWQALKVEPSQRSILGADRDPAFFVYNALTQSFPEEPDLILVEPAREVAAKIADGAGQDDVASFLQNAVDRPGAGWASHRIFEVLKHHGFVPKDERVDA